MNFLKRFWSGLFSLYRYLNEAPTSRWEMIGIASMIYGYSVNTIWIANIGLILLLCSSSDSYWQWKRKQVTNESWACEGEICQCRKS